MKKFLLLLIAGLLIFSAQVEAAPKWNELAAQMVKKESVAKTPE